MARPERARIDVIGVQLLDRHGEIARSCARFTRVAPFYRQDARLDSAAAGRVSGALPCRLGPLGVAICRAETMPPSKPTVHHQPRSRTNRFAEIAHEQVRARSRRT